jgi:predicted transposase YbfD/YdcC
MATLEDFQTLAQLLREHFEKIEDPRVDRTKLHPLSDLITIALCSTLAGGTDWEDMPEWALAQDQEWLKDKLGLKLPNGIAHHDTFRRTISRISPEQIAPCLSVILARFRQEHEVVGIDGKVMKGSKVVQGTGDTGSTEDTAVMGHKAITLLNAWANDSKIMIAQGSIPEGTNEIGAMPAFLESLEIAGCTITTDAAHCQTETVEIIRRKQAHYLLTLKDNQPKLHQAVVAAFTHADHNPDVVHSTHEQSGKERGRTEWRKCRVIAVDDWLLPEDPLRRWKDLNCIICVERRREYKKAGVVKVSHSQTYHISSHAPDAETLQGKVRARWGVENRGHYVLDVLFGEDSCRIRKDHGPANLALLRRICLNLVRLAPNVKGSLRSRIKRAGWNPNFLYDLLLLPVPDPLGSRVSVAKGARAAEEVEI